MYEWNVYVGDVGYVGSVHADTESEARTEARRKFGIDEYRSMSDDRLCIFRNDAFVVHNTKKDSTREKLKALGFDPKDIENVTNEWIVFVDKPVVYIGTVKADSKRAAERVAIVKFGVNAKREDTDGHISLIFLNDKLVIRKR